MANAIFNNFEAVEAKGFARQSSMESLETSPWPEKEQNAV